MKAHVYTIDGHKKAEIELPKIFKSIVREDIVQKCLEATREMQPWGIYTEAGKRHSASGTISHKRHDWKGQYGRGMSRVPRKAMWRRGTQFNWVGAEVSGTRGGRRPHGPKPSFSVSKINKKEMKIGMASAFAATTMENYIVKRYASLDKLAVPMPLVLSTDGKMKSKDFITFLKKVAAPMFDIMIRNKAIRAGRGKTRGRKYKRNAGMLLVTGHNEDLKAAGVETKSVKEVRISDLYPLGRLVMYTEKALGELAK